jgi:hypothetical protein
MLVYNSLKRAYLSYLNALWPSRANSWVIQRV